MAKHYIRLDNNSNIIKGFSDDFEQPLKSDICIAEDAGRHFEMLDMINPALNEIGVWMYKYIDNVILIKSDEDKQSDRKAIPVVKTELETLKETVDAMLISMLGGGV